MDFHNVAESGALTATLLERQLPTALTLGPTIASVIVGVNDVLRGTFDLSRTGRALDDAVGQLSASGAVVLTARLPDPGRMFGLPNSLSQSLARRIGAVNHMADVVAARHRTVHFDAAANAQTYDRRMWSVDRLHPSERGHRFLAVAFADLLVERGFPVHRRPSPEPTNSAPSWLASARWMATKGTKWLYARSTDLLPALAAMTLREWCYRVCGNVWLIDAAVTAELERAIAALRPDATLDAPEWTPPLVRVGASPAPPAPQPR